MSGLQCPCGQAHQLSVRARAAYGNVTAGSPPTVLVHAPGGSWQVPRIWIAVHGLKAAELPALAAQYGFEEAERP